MNIRESYFKQYYLSIQLPVGEGAEPGLRRAQLGAYHAIASHFTLSNEPALVVMPTGSGKTAVLMMTAFGQRARRALVITPSVLVRRQIAERFGSLVKLRDIGVVADDEEAFPGPRVQEVAGKIRDAGGWEALRAYDVVVGTPLSLSPGAQGVADAPSDLFDLILMDEAHHGPAKTWQALLDAFPQARQVHFTATPFRRDEKPLKAEIVYSYRLSEAHRDGIFGDIEWVRVDAAGNADSDVAIAQKTEEVFRHDESAGYKHLIMVRTDSRSRANDLKEIYAHHTELNLRLVHSGLAPRTIERTIAKLRAGELDGIICVDMLGEGFDLPTLKIAAVHAPHRSLAVTLQFIGRFARTVADDPIGIAKFVAVPSEIEIESRKLYEESDAWQEIVINLSEGRIQEEESMREQLGLFERVIVPPHDLEDVSPHAFRPLKHVKIYRVHLSPAEIHIAAQIEMPKPFSIVERWDSIDLSATIFITQLRTRPDWTDLEELDKIEYDLFVIYHDRESNLLFINASRRTQSLYEHLASVFTAGEHRILPLSQVNRVLATLSDFHFFNVGMRRRALHPTSETYQIKTGSNTQNAVRPTDGAMYDRGHVACTGTTAEGEDEYIGYSSASKVWSTESVLIPQLISWAQQLADRIENYDDVHTGSGVDHLSVGIELDELPDGIIAVDWPLDAYTKARILVNQETGKRHPLTSFDVKIDRQASSNGTVRILVLGPDTRFEIDHRLTERGPTFELVSENCRRAVVTIAHDEVPLLSYFHTHPPPLFLSDFSAIREGQLFKARGELKPFEQSQFLVIPWDAEGVDIEREFYKGGDVRDRLSIHDFLEARLCQDENEVVFYDHGSGEVADFVTFGCVDGAIYVRFYHCKKSAGAAPGSRVADVYEVASQVIKSLIWLRSGLTGIRNQVIYRCTSRDGSWFAKGDQDLLEEIVSAQRNRSVSYEMILVQPGISKSKMEENVTTALGAADRFIIDHNCQPLRVWGSE